MSLERKHFTWQNFVPTHLLCWPRSNKAEQLVYSWCDACPLNRIACICLFSTSIPLSPSGFGFISCMAYINDQRISPDRYKTRECTVTHRINHEISINAHSDSKSRFMCLRLTIYRGHMYYTNMVPCKLYRVCCTRSFNWIFQPDYFVVRSRKMLAKFVAYPTWMIRSEFGRNPYHGVGIASFECCFTALAVINVT